MCIFVAILHNNTDKKMNKKLFEKVKSLCKDTGLSEKYLKAITEKLGGSVEDDSTDEAAIETAANLVADVAKESQGEATRWASKNKDPKQTHGQDPDPDPDPKPDPSKGDSEVAKALAKMQQQLEQYGAEVASLKAEKAKGERMATIEALMETHKIPAYLRKTLAKSIADDEDAEATIKEFAQGLITNGLPTNETEGSKAASDQQVDEAADALLKSIEVEQ